MLHRAMDDQPCVLVFTFSICRMLALVLRAAQSAIYNRQQSKYIFLSDGRGNLAQAVRV